MERLRKVNNPGAALSAKIITQGAIYGALFSASSNTQAMEKRVFTTREITKSTGLTERETEEAIKRLSCNSEVTTIQHKGFNAGIYGSEPAPVVIEQIFNIKSTEYRHYSVNTSALLKLADYLPRVASIKLRQLYEPEPPRAPEPAEVYDPGRHITFGDFAKLYFRELNLGRNTLIKKLRERRFLQPNNMPYQQYIKNGFFVIETKPIRRNSETEPRIGYTTKLTHKGARWLRAELTKQSKEF
jgi:phage antirepressor YoqD-like protein